MAIANSDLDQGSQQCMVGLHNWNKFRELYKLSFSVKGRQQADISQGYLYT